MGNPKYEAYCREIARFPQTGIFDSRASLHFTQKKLPAKLQVQENMRMRHTMHPYMKTINVIQMVGKETTADRDDEEMPEDVEKNFVCRRRRSGIAQTGRCFGPMPGKAEAGPRTARDGGRQNAAKEGTGICVCEPQPEMENFKKREADLREHQEQMRYTKFRKSPQ